MDGVKIFKTKENNQSFVGVTEADYMNPRNH